MSLIGRIGDSISNSTRGFTHAVLNTGRAIGDVFTGDLSGAGSHMSGAWDGIKRVGEGATLGLSNSIWGNNDSAGEIGSGLDSAMSNLETDLSGIRDLYGSAVYGEDGSPVRTPSTLLDRYDTQSGIAGDTMASALGAGSPDNVQRYLNPMADRIQQSAVRAVEGGAGSALQSSATNRNAATAAANATANMWDTAQRHAMDDASNTMKVGANQATMAQQGLESSWRPTETLSQLQADIASQKLNAEIAKIQSQAQKEVAENTSGFFGSGGILGTGLRI